LKIIEALILSSPNMSQLLLLYYAPAESCATVGCPRRTTMDKLLVGVG
jgi:hypothetical protein